MERGEKKDQCSNVVPKAEQGLLLLLAMSLLLVQILRCPTRSVLAWVWSWSFKKEQSETYRGWRGSENVLWGNLGNFPPHSLSWGCGFIPLLGLCCSPPPFFFCRVTLFLHEWFKGFCYYLKIKGAHHYVLISMAVLHMLQFLECCWRAAISSWIGYILSTRRSHGGKLRLTVICYNKQMFTVTGMLVLNSFTTVH